MILKRWLLFFGIFISSLFGCSRSDSVSYEKKIDSFGSQKEIKRIISTTPSITETLFEMGLGNRIIAVSNYCVYPREIEKLPKIGGLYDPNFEAIIALSPDLVIALKENEEFAHRLEKFGIAVLRIDHRTIDGIFESFKLIGERIGGEYQEKGAILEQSMQARIETIRSRTKDLLKPSVLISIDRIRGTGRITDVSIAGHNPYFNEILDIAGGINAAQGIGIPVPVVSVEGIMALDPEVVIDLATDWNNTIKGREKQWIDLCRNDWMSLDHRVRAVKNGRIHAIPEDYATVPGPRVILLIERITSILHPELSL